MIVGLGSYVGGKYKTRHLLHFCIPFKGKFHGSRGYMHSPTQFYREGIVITR